MSAGDRLGAHHARGRSRADPRPRGRARPPDIDQARSRSSPQPSGPGAARLRLRGERDRRRRRPSGHCPGPVRAHRWRRSTAASRNGDRPGPLPRLPGRRRQLLGQHRGRHRADTQLFLFHADGHGVYANDDSQATRQSTLPALDPLTPAAPGIYLLAISPYDRDPQSPAGRDLPGGGGVLGPPGRGLAGAVGVAAAPACRAPIASRSRARPPARRRTHAADGGSPRAAGRRLGGARRHVNVAFNCADEGGSGLASCEGSVANGEPLDTVDSRRRAL